MQNSMYKVAGFDIGKDAPLWLKTFMERIEKERGYVLTSQKYLFAMAGWMAIPAGCTISVSGSPITRPKV